MKTLLAALARRRLQSLPRAPPCAELRQANVDYFEGLVSRDYRAVRAAQAVAARYEGPQRVLSPVVRAAADEKFAPRARVLAAWVRDLREQREEQASGILSPPEQLTAEEEREQDAFLGRFKRWLGGDDAAGPFQYE